ncbi:MAG: S9 family peptidase [Chloroflexota bacterium]|nr:S9 family peptidase [Chloroflexota bacterium]MDE2961203.1 S9 family peptidase [Chloroflexota bacterium]
MTQPIGPDLFRHLKTVGDPTVSPDGSRCAYVLSWIDQDSSEPRARIYQAGLDAAPDGAPPQPFTQGNNDGHPRYSPNGATLAFLRAGGNGAGSTRQVWTMPAGGGEAAQLTDLAGDVREFVWSPDSARLAVVSDVAPMDRPKELDLPAAKEVRRIRYRHDAIGWRGDSHFHLFLVDAATGKSCQITSGDWDDMAPAWSPDGRRLAFISGRSGDRDITATNEVYVVDVADGAVSGEEPSEPEPWSQGLADVAAVSWSPDGSRLLAAGGTGDGLAVLWQAYLYILEPGRPPQQLTDDSLRPCLGYPGIYPPLDLRWLPGDEDDGCIVFLGDSQGETRLYEMAVKPEGRSAPAAITAGGELLSGVAMDAAANRVVVAGSHPASPSDAYVINRLAQPCETNRRRLTSHNDAWLSRHAPAPMEKFVLEREDWDIECRLYHPPGFDPKQRYPLVLEIHGGPNGAFYDSFVPWHQVLAGAGYLTLAVNPRGSSTYGEEFVNAVLGDWGGDDYRDLMAALDLICQRDYVDTDRLGVHGYSYGGYMTTWMIGHTDRFRAAVAGAPCIDLWTMYGTSDIATSFGETQWAIRLAGGMPISRPLANELAEGVDTLAFRLLQRSPIKFAPQVETPVLLLHGEADARCPISQSEQYFQVMKRLDKEVEMVRFPGCGHGFLRTGHVALRQEYLERMLGWFQRWL